VARTPLWISRRISMARLLVCAVLVMSGLAISTSPAQAASNRLPNGNKLIAGSCITDSGSNGSAKFCVGKNYNLNLYHNGNICWSWQANTHLSGPDAFVKVAPNGDVKFWQYAGGPMLWDSGTTMFSGADLVVGAASYGKAILAVDTGTAFFIFKLCS